MKSELTEIANELESLSWSLNNAYLSDLAARLVALAEDVES